MRYYFQRPPEGRDYRFTVQENFADQKLTFFLYKKEGEKETLSDQKTFDVADIWVSNFYALLPIKNGKIQDPVNMDLYRGQVGATEHLKRVYQYEDFLCYLIFGETPTLDKMSTLALHYFDHDRLNENEGKYMNFYEIVVMAVDDPTKILMDEEKRKTLVSLASNESLSGMEAQLDLLSGIFLTMLDLWKKQSPELYTELRGTSQLVSYEETFKEFGVQSVKDVVSMLEEMKNQKRKIREEQQRYFAQRRQIDLQSQTR